MTQKILMKIRWCRTSKNGKAMKGWLVCESGKRAGQAKAEVVEVFDSFCLRWGRTYPFALMVVCSRKEAPLNLSSSLGTGFLAAKTEAYEEKRAAAEEV